MILIDTELLQFFLPNIRNHASPSWKIKGQTDFTSVLFIRLYILGVSISFTLCFSTCTDVQIHIFIKKEFIVLYLLQCWHYLKYFLMFQNGLLDHLVLYLNNKILPNYFSRDYFTLAKKNVICTSVTKKYYLKSYCLDYWDFYSWDSSK